MNDKLRIVVARTLGRSPAGRLDVQPWLSDPVEIQKFVEADCGADAFTIQNGKLVALRDNGNGTTRTIKTYDIQEVGKA